MEGFYNVYILLSEKDGNKYTGYTSNLDQRLKAHEDGKVPSTRHRRPLKLLYFEACRNKEDALRREKY
jgi:putative endonuclease